MISVCFESMAAIWIYGKKKLLAEPMEQQVYAAQDNLDNVKKNMEIREKELQEQILKLGKEAIAKKKTGDLHAARIKTAERVRLQKRLDKLRSSINIINVNLDTIKNSELDKEIMQSLKASSMALKKAGIGVNVAEMENIMNVLDEQMRDMQDVTNVMATPVTYSMEDEEELDQELNNLLHEDEVTLLPPQSNKMKLKPIAEEPALTATLVTVEDLEDNEIQPAQPAQQAKLAVQS